MIAIVAGVLAGKAGNGGNAWSRLSWVRGLEQLGVETYFVEQSSDGLSSPAYFDAVIAEFGDARRSALLDGDGAVIAGGCPAEELLSAARECSLLINLSGHLQAPALRRLIDRAVYIDDDPGYTQFWRASGLIPGRLEGHVAHYTFGTRIGDHRCPIPTGGISWRGIRPPVVLSDWRKEPSASCQRVTTVASWRGPYGPVEHNGTRFGQKVHEFRKFSALPRLAGRRLEIALEIAAAESAAAQQLRGDGWALVDPRACAGDPASFRRYVQESDAELSVAQGIYVDTCCGWFSDRTTRYLAAGRPAIVQDTGFSSDLQPGEGLLSFTSRREALAALRAVERDYAAHAVAARATAEQHFDSRRVIGDVLEDIL